MIHSITLCKGQANSQLAVFVLNDVMSLLLNGFASWA